MKTRNSWRDNASQFEMSGQGNIHSSQLTDLFESELKDIYWAERELIKEIPKMIKRATSQNLIDALENHLAQTKEEFTRLEHVFEMLVKKATAKKCEAMEGLFKEGKDIIDEYE